MNRQWYFGAIAIIVASLLFHQSLLLLLGLLALFVLLTADIWAKYCMRNVRYTRELTEKRALFGEEILLSLSIENAKILPLPWLEIEEIIPRGLNFKGPSLRVSANNNSVLLESLFSLRWYERVTRRYIVACTVRGVHTFGPTTLRSGDVFGFQSSQETFANRQYLLVYPMVVPLTRFGLPARHPFGDYNAPRRMLEDPSRVVGVRDYMYGDDMRRVHWKATARALKMQSKLYQPTTTYTLVIFLNVATQLDVWYGIHPEIQELAICAAASVANWALNQGLAVGLFANTTMYMPELGMARPADEGQTAVATEDTVSVESLVAQQLKRRRIQLSPSGNEEQRRRIMETLARVQSYFGSPIEELVQAERGRLPAGATVVLITSSINDPLLDALARLRQSGHSVTILFVGDNPVAPKLAGVTIYQIGGEETWKQFMASYKVPASETSERLAAPNSITL